MFNANQIPLENTHTQGSVLSTQYSADAFVQRKSRAKHVTFLSNVVNIHFATQAQFRCHKPRDQS